MLEKTLESPFACKEIQPVHSKGDQSWVFFGKNDAEAETPIFWLPDVAKYIINFKTEETLMYRTVLWTLWEKERVGRFGRMALKHVKYHV